MAYDTTHDCSQVRAWLLDLVDGFIDVLAFVDDQVECGYAVNVVV